MESLPTSTLARIQAYPFASKNHTGNCVLYVMSRDQRVSDNHALVTAQHYAIQKNLPFAVVFILHAVSQRRAREQYEFMIAGLREVESKLALLNIPLLMLVGTPKAVFPPTINHLKPDAIFFDFNPLRGPKNLVEQTAKLVPTFTVDTHNIVPVWRASDKQEYGARTIRSKISNQLAQFAQLPPPPKVHPIVWPGTVMPLTQLDKKIAALLNDIATNNTKISFVPGESAALHHTEDFIANRLRGYALQRNNPTKNGLSDFSPYFHFGQLCSLTVYIKVIEAAQADPSLQADVDALVEEMVVRKELSDNYCYYNTNYDSLTGAPQWAQATLQKHQADKREFIYSYQQFCDAQTHDEAWNAAQLQLRISGKIHGYMRMYWAKKVLEWSKSPEDALATLLALNDFYSIDGGDPNGYVGILWSIAGLHDRPWGERAVYGTVRCMVYAGLKRKFDIQAYIDYNKM